MYCLDCDRFQRPEHFSTVKDHKHREYSIDSDNNVVCTFIDLDKVVALLADIRLDVDGDKTSIVMRVYDSDTKQWYSLFENKSRIKNKSDERYKRGMGVREVQNRLLEADSVKAFVLLRNMRVENIRDAIEAANGIDNLLAEKQEAEKDLRNITACELVLINSRWIPRELEA